MGLNVVGRVLRDRGIGNCGRESLSVLFGDRLDRGDRFDRFWQPRAAALGGFGGIFFVVLDFFCFLKIRLFTKQFHQNTIKKQGYYFSYPCLASLKSQFD